MNKYKWLTVAAIFILGVVGVHPLQATGEKFMTETSERQSVPLSQLWVELGKNYDRFFTLEEAWKDGEPWSKLESQRVQRSTEKKTLEQELEQLRQTVPDFNYEINNADSRIVHIIDARLARQKEYGLERVINSIDFTGKVNELSTAIANQGIPVSPPQLMSTHEQADYSTVVRVKGEGLKVRNALSNFIPLEGRGRILWIARTKLGQGEVSYIYYLWPGKKN